MTVPKNEADDGRPGGDGVALKPGPAPASGTLQAVPAAPALALAGISKRFGSVHVLSGVDFDVRTGEVHALLGENGAGKTTLMSVASGVCRPDAGTISLNGTTLRPRTPRDALRHGLGIVHQNYQLVRNMLVAENLHIGWEATSFAISDSRLRSRAAELGERFGLAVDPDARIGQLSVGEMQRVAILRTLVRGARTLVLDEPTAALTPHEVDQLFTAVREMTASGYSVVFISHKLAEVLEIADRVSVLRGGRNVATLPTGDCTTGSLARLMVGRTVPAPERQPARIGPAVAALTGVHAVDDRGLAALHGVDLRVHAGEIVGVAGVAGNGQRELAEVLTGTRRLTAGDIAICEVSLAGHEPRAFLDAGVGHIPEDIGSGLALNAPIALSASMRRIRRAPVRRGLLVSRPAMRRHAAQIMDTADLSDVNPARRAATLSGGQAQRLIVYRELEASSRVLVASHPTRGLDIAATADVHRALLAIRHEGVGILLVSEDLDEVMALSDRIVVAYEGRILGGFERPDFDRERIGMLMGGVTTPSDPSDAQGQAR
ncbi:ABC transporter ATP-binding protein [Streptomyces sp. NBC_00878]|uniref:ABC transporter ATP-binding protein n=1 Tax=Streptomyces sp. NBC_00878 TaxID=2975854 RepID=UPI0022572C67|nr:ABC transporter ATP-binding protein [Streptomyces sp. NBC_00878]MCX4911700.1 ABC transporter ATP-binding protein [Streptomyces sp. NBC_00878]